MTEIDVSSGAKVSIFPADFESAMALKNAVANELSKSNINIENFDIANLMQQDISVLEPLFKMALAVDSSPSVNEALFACLSKCLYEGQKITKQTFDDVKAREDYYEIVFGCLKENLTPFFKGLVSKFNQLPAQVKSPESPK